LEDEIISILVVGGGRSNIPINEEYIPTPRFLVGGQGLSTKGILESEVAQGSTGE